MNNLVLRMGLVYALALSLTAGIWTLDDELGRTVLLFVNAVFWTFAVCMILIIAVVSIIQTFMEE